MEVPGPPIAAYAGPLGRRGHGLLACLLGSRGHFRTLGETSSLSWRYERVDRSTLPIAILCLFIGLIIFRSSLCWNILLNVFRKCFVLPCDSCEQRNFKVMKICRKYAEIYSINSNRWYLKSHTFIHRFQSDPRFLSKHSISAERKFFFF